MKRFAHYPAVLFVAAFWGTFPAPAHEGAHEKTQEGVSDTLELPDLNVYTEPERTIAGSQNIRDRDLKLRPIINPSDVIKVTPGLFTATHAGGGKAYQYFMRGFDVDHGTDLAFWVDNMPINNVSHGHGQGYTDLHFIIPELVERLEVRKGPYHARYGDFATAGALRLKLRKRLPEPYLQVSGGFFNTGRILGAATLGKAPHAPYIAAEVYQSDGPFNNEEDLERYNLFGRAPLLHDAERELYVTAMTYGGGWNASGQIPERAVESGLIDRWGSIDPSEGGTSQRSSLSLDYTQQLGRDFFAETSLYLIQYRLNMFSNFTFFDGDPVNGDQIEQMDRRTVTGFSSEFNFNQNFFGVPALSGWTKAGVQFRNDRIHTELGNAVERSRLSTTIDAETWESSMGAYVEERFQPLSRLTLVLGMRADLFTYDVEDNIPENEFSNPKTSGSAHATIGSPKTSVMVKAMDNLDLFMSAGRGFHSNDARGVVLGRNAVTPLAAALGAETGFRTQLWKKLDLAGGVWLLDLESELVWIGDEGITEPSGETRRVGWDLEARYQLLPWLWLDADVSLSRGTFTDEPDDANTVPNAPAALANAGLSFEHPVGLSGGLRYTFLGDRPLTEDESITGEGFQLLNFHLGYRLSRVEIFSQLENVLNSEYAATQFATESRLQEETASVEEVHFVPGNPFNARAGVKVYY